MIDLRCGDAREILGGCWGDEACVIVDPPWDAPDLLVWVSETVGNYESLLVFTDARHVSGPLYLWGAPSWIFVWDTMNTWSCGPRSPLQQTKLCFWYGREYTNAATWGTPPARKNHPSTKSIPSDGRRLTDLWRESLRWLHHPGAGNGSAGTERFSKRQGDPALRHAKPLGWITLLIANTSAATTRVMDPFCGSGTSLRAAKDLGREAVGVDISARAIEMCRQRLKQEVLL